MLNNYSFLLLTLLFCTFVLPVPGIVRYVLTVILFLSSIYMVSLSKRMIDGAFIKWISLFSIFCLLSLLWSVSIETSISVFSRMMSNIAFTSFIVIYVRNYNDLKNILLAFYVSSVVYLIFLFSVMDISMLGTDRFVRAMVDEEMTEKYNSNYIAGQFVIAIYFGYFLFWKLLKVSNVNRYMYIGITLVMLYVIFISGSRMSIILLTIPLIVFNLKRKNFLKGIGNAMVAVVCLYFIVMKIPIVYDILGTRIEDAVNVLTNNEQGTEDTSRILLIQFGWERFLESPILGHGINCFRFFSNQSSLFLGKNYYAHNNYIELLADIGFVGFFIYYYFAHWYLYRNYKKMDSKLSKKVILVLLLAIIASDFSWVAYYGFLSQMLLCTTFAIVNVEKYNQRRNAKLT